MDEGGGSEYKPLLRQGKEKIGWEIPGFQLERRSQSSYCFCHRFYKKTQEQKNYVATYSTGTFLPAAKPTGHRTVRVVVVVVVGGLL